jgi:hypothetical protein
MPILQIKSVAFNNRLLTILLCCVSFLIKWVTTCNWGIQPRDSIIQRGNFVSLLEYLAFCCVGQCNSVNTSKIKHLKSTGDELNSACSLFQEIIEDIQQTTDLKMTLGYAESWWRINYWHSSLNWSHIAPKKPQKIIYKFQEYAWSYLFMLNLETASVL